ncbi:hypothetical protein MKW92_016037, partial [Papaver armeniacum]
WADCGLKESPDIKDSDDKDVLEATSETKLRGVDCTNPRFGDPFARKAAST